jgi:integrase
MSTQRRTRVESGIYRRPDGRLEIGYRDAQGRQRWRVVEGGIAAARKQLTAARAQRDRGDHAPDARLTFDVAADAWLEARVPRLRENTRLTYAKHADHLRARFGRMKLSAITPDLVARYVAELERSGAKGWTAHGRLAVLSAVFSYAGRHLGHVGGNPVSLLDAFERPGTDDQREHRVVTDDEADALLAAADDHERLMLATAVQTGARKAEVLGLTFADVDVSGRTLAIERQLDRYGKRASLKTKRSRRTVAVSPDLATRLAEHRLARGGRDHDLVFARPDGSPLSHKAADWTLARAVKRAGLERFTWHDLRHSHVSRLFAAGLDPVAIAARVGDSLGVVLTTYAHEYDAARRRQDESAAIGALYDRSYGSAMEASGSSRAQQTPAAAAADMALARQIRDKPQ